MSIEITTTDAATKSGILDALGTKAYTQSEKTKLEGLETSKYKGLYVDFESLTGAYPTGEGGYYADVDSGVGEDVVRYIYDVDDTGWVLQLGESTAETAASIKTKYESNANTNAFTDANLDRITGDNFSVVGDLTVDSTTLHVDSSNDRVGIGTNTPFHVLDVAGNAALGFETLFVDGANLNVGIGTTSPDSSYKLDVNGDTRINGTIYNIQDLDVNGNAIISLGHLACSNFYDGGELGQWGTEVFGDFIFHYGVTISGDVGISGQIEAPNQAATTDNSVMTRSLGDARYGAAATTSSAGIVELATDAETHAATDTTRAVTPSSLLMKKDGTAVLVGDLSGNSRGIGAFDAQGSRNADTQVAGGLGSTAVGTRNTASAAQSTAVGRLNTASTGTGAVAVGYNNTSTGVGASALGNGNSATGGNASAFGYNNTVSGGYKSCGMGGGNTASGTYLALTMGANNTASGTIISIAVGYNNTASQTGCTAIGYSNTATADSAVSIGRENDATNNLGVAIGYNNTASGTSTYAAGFSNTASGSSSVAIGVGNTSSSTGSVAIGYDQDNSGGNSVIMGVQLTNTVDNIFEAGYWSSTSTRTTAIRCHPNGQVAMTIEDSATAPTDGGATAGSEADGTLGRGMFSIQKNGTAVTLYYNNAGTIQSLSLGTLS